MLIFGVPGNHIGFAMVLIFDGSMRNILLFSLLFLFPLPALATPVISEVMWMGTDLSTADEWLEVYNPDEEDIDLTGWSITSVNSSAKEIVSLRFQTGTVLAAGEYLVLASKSAATSRLLAEPFAVSSTLSLPNTKLLLRLRNAENVVIDEVDDGVGAPFAGENPSGTGAKASMERVDPLIAGNIKENWRSAVLSLGFDADTKVFGTPGLSSTVESSETEPETEPILVPEPAPLAPPVPVPCTDPLEIAIAVQSGPLVAVGKATVNFQAVATIGSLSGVSCSWSYGDGFSSTSCNPPVHSFVGAGTYSVRLEAKNQCDITVAQEKIVQVLPEPSAAEASSTQTTWYDGSRLILMAALPNPEGTDTGKEWVEIKNPEKKPVDLRGWKIQVGETSVKSYALKSSIGPGETLKIFSSELSFTLPNSASKVSLVTPSGLVLSTIPWSVSAEEGRRYFPDDIRKVTVRGTVISVTDSTTFMLELDGEAMAVLGKETVLLRIPGVYSVDESKAYEFIRALMENKNIELQFSTELWDEAGRLVSDAIIDSHTLVSQRMLMSKIWIQDKALIEDKKDDSIFKKSGINNDHVRVGDIRISEVYPSPFPSPKDASDSDWKNREWLEIENTTQRAIDLSGWKITTSKSEKALPEGLNVGSGSMFVLYADTMKLSLRNAGDTVSLIAPDKLVVSSFYFPSVKNGLSYGLNDEQFCTTIVPTPGEVNVCVSSILASKKAVKKSGKTASVKKTSARVKSYAASYRAQVSDDAVLEEEILLPHFEKKLPQLATMGAFFLGAGIPLLVFFLYAQSGQLRRWFVRLTSSETA